jgi:prepilin-type N-terminal cleavage/methylation domain-containing protein
MKAITSNERGFGLTELVVVVAVLGILTIFAVPNLVSYYQASSLTAGAEQLAAVMNRGRHLAISRNTSVCVERNGTTVRLRTVSCAGTIWTGVGTDSAGTIQIANALTVGGAGSVTFTNTGAATSTVDITFSLTDPKTSRARNVVVSPTGRVFLQ